MSYIGNVTGVNLGIKLVNGKMKVKKSSASDYVILGFWIVMMMIFLFLFVLGILRFDMEYIVNSSIGILSGGYLLSISPMLQNPKNYHIEFVSENQLEGFKLTYKGKLVDVKYNIDKEGKFMFADNAKKTNCISYADKSKMKTRTKYAIVNYFAKWLANNDLLSSKTTFTVE